jgi:hypothetical protein
MSYCDTNIISRYELDINSICKKIAKLTEDQQNAQLRLYLMTLDLILDKWSIQIDELFQKDGVYMPLEFVKNHKIQIHMAHRGYMFAVDYQHKKALNIINMRKTYLKRYLDSRKRRITLWDTNISNIIISYM